MKTYLISEVKDEKLRFGMSFAVANQSSSIMESYENCICFFFFRGGGVQSKFIKEKIKGEDTSHLSSHRR